MVIGCIEGGKIEEVTMREFNLLMAEERIVEGVDVDVGERDAGRCIEEDGSIFGTFGKRSENFKQKLIKYRIYSLSFISYFNYFMGRISYPVSNIFIHRIQIFISDNLLQALCQKPNLMML